MTSTSRHIYHRIHPRCSNHHALFTLTHLWTGAILFLMTMFFVFGSFPVSFIAHTHMYVCTYTMNKFLFSLVPATICSPLGTLIMGNERFQARFPHRSQNTEHVPVISPHALEHIHLSRAPSSRSSSSSQASPGLNPTNHLYGCQLNAHKYYIHVEGMQNWDVQVLTY